jgi:30S ribosomal protein S31
MGKGDKKSRRGKIIIGSFGVRRSRKKIKTSFVRKVQEPAAKKPVEEQLVIPIPVEEAPVIAEVTEEAAPVKKPARKAPAKKPAAKAEETKEEAKPKAPKPRKKPAGPAEKKDEPPAE